MEEHQVPVVLEFILERVTNIAMGTEVDSVNEFEDILCLDPSLTLESGWVQDLASALSLDLDDELLEVDLQAAERWAKKKGKKLAPGLAIVRKPAETVGWIADYLERQPSLPLTLKQVDPLIRELTHYRDLIDRRTEETSREPD